MWDTFMAYLMTILLAGLKISILFLCWGLLLLGVPTYIQHL